MTVFDYLNSILFTKVPESNTEEYNNFMMNRWVSMSVPINALIINESTNKNQVWSKEDHYKFMLNLIPQCRRMRVNYIKKSKEKIEKPDKDEEQSIIIQSKIKEQSCRETRNNMEMIKYLHDVR